jgi:hypothetical protein
VYEKINGVRIEENWSLMLRDEDGPDAPGAKQPMLAVCESHKNFRSARSSNARSSDELPHRGSPGRCAATWEGFSERLYSIGGVQRENYDSRSQNLPSVN